MANTVPPGPRVLLASPLPPTIGGIASWTEEVLASPLRDCFALALFDTAWSERGVRARSRWQIGRAAGAVAQLARFVAALRRHRPSLVHLASSYHWGFVRDAAMIGLSRAAGARVVLHLHGGDFVEFFARLPSVASRATQAVLRQCDGVVVLDVRTEAAVGDLIGPARVWRVANAVDVPARLPGPEAGPRDPVRLLYPGALLEAKGILDLLRAFEGVAGASLTLVGPMDDGFAAQLRAHPMIASERVELLSERPRDEVLALVAACDVVVLPSHREGLPLTLLEAMAAGRAIVATPVGAIPDAVRDGVEARLVPPRDPERLREALQALVDRPEERVALGRAAHARARERFSREAMAEALTKVWGEVLRSSPNSPGASPTEHPLRRTLP